MFLKSLTLSNILSFGPEPHTVELGPLNVIIGPNGSGKSNFIEAVGLLKAAPRDIQEPIRQGGGIFEWICKSSERYSDASIEAEFTYKGNRQIRYKCEFSEVATDLMLMEESIFSTSGFMKSLPIVVSLGKISVAGQIEALENKELEYDHSRSVLSQLRNPFAPTIIYIYICRTTQEDRYLFRITGREKSADAPASEKRSAERVLGKRREQSGAYSQSN